MGDLLAAPKSTYKIVQKHERKIGELFEKKQFRDKRRIRQNNEIIE